MVLPSPSSVQMLLSVKGDFGARVLLVFFEGAYFVDFRHFFLEKNSVTDEFARNVVSRHPEAIVGGGN